jgi:hypothetical protein
MEVIYAPEMAEKNKISTTYLDVKRGRTAEREAVLTAGL